MARTMSSVSAFSAFGRLSRITPSEPSVVTTSSSSFSSTLAVSVIYFASISLRATISRMISLVPSRIWCTRRSRTIFSMPYSDR